MPAGAVAPLSGPPGAEIPPLQLCWVEVRPPPMALPGTAGDPTTLANPAPKPLGRGCLASFETEKADQKSSELLLRSFFPCLEE